MTFLPTRALPIRIDARSTHLLDRRTRPFRPPAAVSAEGLVPRWWEEWPGRLEAEVAAFERRGLRFEVDDDYLQAGTVVLRGQMEVEPDRTEEIVVVYPDPFPFTRFSVYAPNLRLDRHQHPFGHILCVFPRGSEHWRPSTMAGDVVAERVPELVRVVREGGDVLREAEVAQGEPFTDYYTFWPRGGILVPPAALEMPQSASSGSLEIDMAKNDDWLRAAADPSRQQRPLSIGQGLLTRVQGPGGLLAGDDGLGAGFNGPRWKGRWVRLDKPIAADGPEFLTALLQEHPDLDKAPLANRGFRIFGVVFPEEVRQGEWQDAWVFVAQWRSRGGRGSPSGGAALVRGMRGGREHLSERIPELRALQSRKVALAGLGSLGEAAARELGRALVEELRVLDFDAVEAGNAVRWPDGFRAAGIDKVLFTDSDFALQYPHTRVVPVRLHVGMAPLEPDGRREAEALSEWLDGADLAMDLTAEANVTSALCYLARRQSVPAVVAWSVEGAGAVAARIIPGETGCYQCFEHHLSKERGTIALPSPLCRDWVQPPGCAEATFPAPNLDLAGASEMAVRLAFGELSRGTPGGYPRLRHDVYVQFLREPDGSLVDPPRWEGHPLPVHADCARCNGDD